MSVGLPQCPKSELSCKHFSNYDFGCSFPQSLPVPLPPTVSLSSSLSFSLSLTLYMFFNSVAGSDRLCGVVQKRGDEQENRTAQH